MRWITGLAVLCAAAFRICAQPSMLPAQDLGSLAVNTTTTATVVVSGLTSVPIFSVRYGIEFSIFGTSCVSVAANSFTCTLTVRFAPKYAGLGQDALEYVRPDGTPSLVAFLHGIGLAPVAVLRPGVITTFAGTTLGSSGDNGPATAAQLWNPQGLAIDNYGNIYISDSAAQLVRRVDTSGIITTYAGNSNNTNGSSLGDGGPATSAMLNVPAGLALDGAGNLYIADSQNNVVRKVDPASGVITTVAGNGTVSTNLGDGGLATSASLFNPTDVAVDGAGNLYIADQYNNRIRCVNAQTGIITTVAGGGNSPGTDGLGDGGPATSAILSDPAGIALDSAGHLYIADTGNGAIREVTNGTISAVAGTATTSTLNEPSGIRVDAGGNIYIADTNNSLVWEVNAAGIMFVLAGQSGQFGFNGNNVIANQAELYTPTGIALDASGTLYIADQGNSLVRKIVPGPSALTFATFPAGSMSPPQTVSVDNVGNQALTFSSVTVSGNFSEPSSGGTDCATALTLAPASSCLAAITFDPQGAGILTGALSLQTNTQPSITVVSLSGTGVAASGVTVSATELSFSSQPAESSSAAQTVTITNSSTATLSTPSFSISGPAASDFTVTSNCTSSLAPAAACTVSVIFTPTATGNRTATLTLNETNTNTQLQLSQSVILSGVGAPAATLVTPSVISFSNTALSTLPMTQTATLTNVSAVPLGIYSIATTRPDVFTITSTCPASVAPLASCTVSVTFTPTSSAVSSAALTFTFTSGMTQSLTLTTASPMVLLAGPTSSLGPQTRNVRSAPIPYLLQNMGSSALSLSSISIDGANAGDFQQVNDCGTSVPTGQGCTIWITYLPTGNSPASSSAAITVTDSAPGSPHSVAIAGTATGLPQAQIDFDTPSPRATVAGTIPLSGWAISSDGPITALTLAIDGVNFGSVTYGTSRPDVCAVYPGRASCPNVGWNSSLDTTKLADGAHTLTLTATLSSGKTTAALPLTVANWARAVNKTTRIFVDYPAAGATLSGSATVGGWAIDDAASVSSVTLAVDGVPLENANYGIARPDVCAAFPGRSGCPNVGWNALLDTRQFSNGQHTLAVTVQTSNSTSATIAVAFKIANATAAGLTSCIDMPGSGAVSGILSAAGWVLDPAASISSVALSVDGIPQGAAAAVSRPDVCAVFGNQPGCPNVGWSGQIDTRSFADGAHTFALFIKTADGHEVTVSKPFTISNSSAFTSKTTLAIIDTPPPSSGPLSGTVPMAGWSIDEVTGIATNEIAIDGVPMAFIQPSVSRPDVCAAFPAAVGCPLVGWATTFDTSSLPDGSHTLQLTATSQQGMRATRTLTFVTSNAAKAASQGQFIFMDSPISGAAVTGSLTLSGWAIDRTGSIKYVVMAVDGVTVGLAAFGTPRPDVCAVLQSTGCPNVGWTYSLDTTWLSNGPHTLRATECADNGCTSISRQITVANPSTPLRIDIDTPVANYTYSGVITLGGWVVDDNAAINSVTILVDGVPFGAATYGINRPDVCAVFPGRSGCPNVGWSFVLDTTVLSNGAHTLQVSAISTDNVRSTVALSFKTAN